MDEDGWQYFAQKSDEHIKQLKNMLERVAPKEGLSDHEYDHCVWCGNEYYDYLHRGMRHKEKHDPDCLWVEARRLLGDNLED